MKRSSLHPRSRPQVDNPSKTNISSLPLELLQSIFLLVKHAKAYPCIEISQVCASWRALALGTTELWTSIQIRPQSRSQPWVSELMKRSGQRPLTIEVKPFVPDSVQGPLPFRGPPVNFFMKVHASRIQEMTLREYPQGLLRQLFEERTAPLLHTLRIDGVYVEIDFGYTPNFILGDSNFLTDRLRRLSVTRCRVNWNARLFHRLTHLRIRNLPDGIGTKPVLEEFFAVVKRMPTLEYLELGDFLESSANYHSDTPITAFPKISLPSLKTLRLWTTMDETAGILSSIALPAIFKIQTHSYQLLDFGDGLECFDAVINALYEHYQTMTGSPSMQVSQSQSGFTPRSVRLRSVHYPSSRIVLQAFDRVLPLDDVSTKLSRQNHEPRLDLTFDFDDRKWVMQDDLLELFHGLPCHNLVVLQLLGTFEFDRPDEWTEVFDALPALQSLAVSGSSSSGPFFELLVHGLPSTTISDRSKFPLPSLSSITVYRGNPDRSSKWFIRPFKALKKRKEFGVPIHHLLLLDCNRVDAASFRDVVKDVRVAHTPDWSESDSESESDPSDESGLDEDDTVDIW